MPYNRLETKSLFPEAPRGVWGGAEGNKLCRERLWHNCPRRSMVYVSQASKTLFSIKMHSVNIWRSQDRYGTHNGLRPLYVH